MGFLHQNKHRSSLYAKHKETISWAWPTPQRSVVLVLRLLPFWVGGGHWGLARARLVLYKQTIPWPLYFGSFCPTFN